MAEVGEVYSGARVTFSKSLNFKRDVFSICHQNSFEYPENMLRSKKLIQS